MGSFGWNIKPWLQIVADTSYNTVTISGTKNILYGNHFGARYFHRGRNRWGLTPFAEALDRKSTRLNSSHANISYAVFCLKKKKKQKKRETNDTTTSVYDD